jgi:hypothetical protein
MTSKPDLFQPPRIAVWLVTLFTPAEEAESILGDLHEEFSHLAANSGFASARRWFWRQSVKTIAYLLGAGYRAAPWSTSAAVLGGFFGKVVLNRYILWFSLRAMTTIVDKYQIYQSHPGAYFSWLIGGGMLIEQLVLATLVGVAVAVAAKGREMTATVTLGLVGSALPGTGFFVVMAKNVHFEFWMPALSFASSIAVFVGGMIVRMCRSAAPTRHSVM